MMKAGLQPPISVAFAAFLEGGMSINVAARNARNVPSIARALGCRFSRDRRRLTVFLSRAQAAAVLADLRGNGAVAVVFAEPSTHESWQFKGGDAREEPLARGDAGRIRAYVETFVQGVRPLGHPPDLIRLLFAGPREAPVPADWAAVAFTPTAVFTQTPGQAAGEPLRSDP
jgi:hypothetical protein